MKNTLRNVFHSPRFLVGFIIFMIILLTTLIYPYVITRDPLVSLGKGFLEPGTYVSVYDANNAGTYRVTLPEAEINRLESTLAMDDRQRMLDYLTAKGDDVAALDTSNEKLNDLLAAWNAGYDEADAKKNKYEGFSTQAKRNALRRLDNRIKNGNNSSVMTVTKGEGEEATTASVADTDYVKVDEVANVANLPLGTDTPSPTPGRAETTS